MRRGEASAASRWCSWSQFRSTGWLPVAQKMPSWVAQAMSPARVLTTVARLPKKRLTADHEGTKPRRNSSSEPGGFACEQISETRHGVASRYLGCCHEESCRCSCLRGFAAIGWPYALAAPN
jgi:hypothetical protein